jgi:hypothetical protein
MKYHKLEDIASTYQPNIRAEDGTQQRDRWSGLYEGVLVPFGFLFALFLAFLIVMLIRY